MFSRTAAAAGSISRWARCWSRAASWAPRFGASLFRLLQELGQIDTVINILYVLLLGSIGTIMARESIQALRAERTGEPIPARKRRHHPLVASLPLRWRFYRSGLYISPLAPLLLGMVVGVLTMLMGIGGGFVLVPAMLYILGMSANVVVGTSLFQILFVTMATTMMHAMTTKAVDIVLAGAAAARIGHRRADRREAGAGGQSDAPAAGARGDRSAGSAADGARPGLSARRDLHGGAAVRLLASPLSRWCC